MVGYRKGFNTQQALLSLIETQKKVPVKKGYGATVLMGLLKGFDKLNYDLLLARLRAYGFTNK